MQDKASATLLRFLSHASQSGEYHPWLNYVESGVVHVSNVLSVCHTAYKSVIGLVDGHVGICLMHWRSIRM